MNQPNPAWKKILETIPESFHPLITPALQEADALVQKELEKARADLAKYKPYEPLVDNGIGVERIAEALQFAHELEQDPTATIKNLNTHWNLGFTAPGEAPAATPPGDPLEFGDSPVDIANHPMFKQLAEKLDNVQQTFEQRQQADQEAQEIAAFNKKVDDVLAIEGNTHLPKPLLMAYMTQGYSGEQAATELKKYLATGVVVPENNDEVDPPPVMGGDGAAGSGLPSGAVPVGHSVKSSAVDDIVVKILAAQASENNQG